MIQITNFGNQIKTGLSTIILLHRGLYNLFGQLNYTIFLIISDVENFRVWIKEGFNFYVI